MALPTTNFIPQSVYPLGYDTDYTLFQVFNTTQSVLASPNEPWSETIYIIPQPADMPEVWAENGYATLDGELLYYGDVGYDYSTGHVNELKNCIRNLGNKNTHFNPAGTPIYGNVVAEHHNQLARAIVNIENYCYKINQKLIDAEIAESSTDDTGCPSINFDVTILQEDPRAGTTISYNLIIVGNYTSFTINFNDGTFTSTQLTGTHTYGPGSKIDPVATVNANTCTRIATSRDRTTYTDPSPVVTTNEFPIPIPECPPFPDFNFPVCDVPVVQINIPGPTFPNFSCPVQTPSIVIPSNFSFGNLGNISVAVAVSLTIASSITVQAIGIPSIISIVAPSIPSIINVNIPNISLIVPSIPPIQVDANIPPISIAWGDVPSIQVEIPSIPPISFASVPEFPPIVVKSCFSPISVVLQNAGIPSYIPVVWTGPFSIPVIWSAPPTITVQVQCTGSASSASTPKAAISPSSSSPVTSDTASFNPTSFNSRKAFADSVEAENNNPLNADGDTTLNMPIDFEGVGIPSVISFTSPKFEDVYVRHDIPSFIDLRSPTGPIKFEWSQPLPEKFVLDHSLPESISLIGLSIPSAISVESTIPSVIKLESNVNIPSVITFDASNMPTEISVVGIPESIELKHNLPSIIQMVMPENPEIQMVYKGDPIELKVALDYKKFIGEDDDEQPCFAIIPCASKRK